MPDHSHRFLAFVDLIGTSYLYADAVAHSERLVDRRMGLEHAIQKRLQGPVASGRLEIGVFSDTVLVAGKVLDDVLDASAQLLDFVFTKTLRRADVSDLRLLRGGVSSGPELRTRYLRPDERVHVIPFFDGGLAYAFHQENLRRGSRLFLSEQIGPRDTGADLSRFIFAWRAMTGAGRPTKPTAEFLWPGYIYRDHPDTLLMHILNAFSLWRTHPDVAPGAVSPDFYRETLYHFDETIKTCTRSLVTFRDHPRFVDIVRALVRLLPTEQDPMEDTEIRYLWGVWFQVLFVLVVCDLTDVFSKEIRDTLRELDRRDYLDNFVSETDFEDYAPMRKLFS